MVAILAWLRINSSIALCFFSYHLVWIGGRAHRNLTHVGLKGPVPKAVGRLTSLVHLDMGNNKVCKVCGPWNHVTGDLAALATLVNLQSLWVNIFETPACCECHIETNYMFALQVLFIELLLAHASSEMFLGGPFISIDLNYMLSRVNVQDSDIEWGVSFELPRGRLSAHKTVKFVSDIFQRFVQLQGYVFRISGECGDC